MPPGSPGSPGSASVVPRIDVVNARAPSSLPLLSLCSPHIRDSGNNNPEAVSHVTVVPAVTRATSWHRTTGGIGWTGERDRREDGGIRTSREDPTPCSRSRRTTSAPPTTTGR
ncbi:hypothetical protein Strvi_1614 [Streptomyces violaceusniger Tu 4113]|uniref:Uncharacterized protein n=1 Tax=Streptomyces violaceusniger (strain Tu 4113) TaxID=653045 RepID=G2P241_STRV4|nr:hypothetical protein Strvi_1614 [Streptomyces violaceusniger Tu 4113]